MNILSGITVLLVYQLAGEIIVFFADLSVPGPVVGMLLLLATLVVRRQIHESLSGTASALLNHLSLLLTVLLKLVSAPKNQQEFPVMRHLPLRFLM